VTITHPQHPLCGQHLPIVCIRRGERPDIVVRLPDGGHAAVAVSATDLAADALPLLPPVHASHLLDLGGLRRLAQLVDSLRRRGPSPTSSSPEPVDPTSPGRG
jgi:hypothetical protein